jgi:hypothetical protein
MKPEQKQTAHLPDGSTLHHAAGTLRIEPANTARFGQYRAILAAHGLELATNPAQY